MSSAVAKESSMKHLPRSREHRLSPSRALLLSALGALVAVSAAGQDLDAMTKWTEAKVIHYLIVGDFAGKMGILNGAHTIRHAAIADRIELEFDWDNQGMAILGSPVLRNAPTKLGAIDPPPPDITGCPPARIDEAPEFATAIRVTAAFVLLQIELKQQSAAGALPWLGERGMGRCGDSWDPSLSAEATFEVQLQLPPGMLLAMPPESTGYDLSKDGKSLLSKPENGWSWVITPTIVR
jgi:hypothetical protein